MLGYLNCDAAIQTEAAIHQLSADGRVNGRGPVAHVPDKELRRWSNSWFNV
ncbi:hypothetical protein Bpfe_027099, partial [Biomphalaria pfeifferi]